MEFFNLKIGYASKLLEIGVFLMVLSLISGCGGNPSNKTEKDKDERPNIVIIMADDLGFSDLGCYGGEIHTPAIDSLAMNGLRFTSFYNAGRCCPTRASLLTGLYPHQAGIGAMTKDEKLPGYRGYLTENTVTIAEILKKEGYNTGMVGKWHVSETVSLEKEKQLEWLAHEKSYGDFSDVSSYPTSRGFEKYYGNIWGVVDYFDPFSLVNGEEPVASVPDDYYHTIAIGDSAISYVEEFSKEDKPFFLYVAHTAPHWPLQALPEDIEKYKDVYKAGWEAIRKARFQKIQDLNLFGEADVKLSPELFPKLDWENNPDSIWDARAMAVHAAMIDRMDQTIGQLVRTLKEKGEFKNTVIMFLSDNGASAERPSKYGPGFDRAGRTREGKKIKFPVDKNLNALPGPQTVLSGIGPQWANVSNTPFRYYKAKLYEGGICTPFIVHWPKGLKQEGDITAQTGHVIDIMATSLDLAGASYPETFEDREITPMEGKSLVPILKGEVREGHDFLIWEHFGARAIRKDDWKLVRLNRNADWELFNLSEDRTEMNDLSDEYPKKVKELAELWDEQAHRLNVFPTPFQN